MRAFLLSLVFVFLGIAAHADWNLESRKIDFLISSVEQLDADFIRNGQAYDAHTAAGHLRDKLKMAVSGPMSPGADQFTAQNFIEQIASKSYFSGKPYYIRFHNGPTVLARDWLYQQLSTFQP